MIKDTDEQPDEEIYRVRCRGVLSARAFVPMESGRIILPVCACVNQLGSYPNPILLGFYGGFLMQA